MSFLQPKSFGTTNKNVTIVTIYQAKTGVSRNFVPLSSYPCD